MRAHRTQPKRTLRVGAHPAVDFLRADHDALRQRSRLRYLQTRHRLDPCDPDLRLHSRRGPWSPPGHERPCPREHAEGRHLLGGPPHPRGRDHSEETQGDRRGRGRFQPLYQNHRRAAHRHVRRSPRAAARDLEDPRRCRVRIGPGLRKVTPHGEIVRRLDLVPVRGTGCRGHGHQPRAPLPRPSSPAQVQAGCLRMRTRMRRGQRQRRRHHRNRARLEPLRRRQRRLPTGARATARAGSRRYDPHPVYRPLSHVLHPHRRSTAANRALAGGTRGWPRPRSRRRLQ